MTIAEEQLSRLRGHFEEVLNLDRNSIEVIVDEKVPPLKTTPSTKTEVINAIKAMKTGKAAEDDNITAEVLKADVTLIIDELHLLLVQIWDRE